MDEHSAGSKAEKGHLFKPYNPNPLLMSHHMPTQSHPRMSYNVGLTTSNKDIGLHNHKQEPFKRTNTLVSTQPANSISTSGSTRPDIFNSGQSNNSKISQHVNSPVTPKHIPSFLEARSQMKGSLFIHDDSAVKNTKTELHPSYNIDHMMASKRSPRMSEQPDMKFSSIQFGSDPQGKVPSFIQEKPCQKDRRIPYQNQLDRPESSKETFFKNSFQGESLSSSYGSVKRNKVDEFHHDHLDPSSEWVKRSWNKKKEKRVSLADFDKIKDLGSGKYGQVYLVREKTTQFIFALKVIEKRLIKVEQITQQFVRQLKIQSFLNHPNIIRMYGFFDDIANIYIILEVGTGGQLFKQLKKHQSMPQAKVAALMRQVCQAVNELHSYHIIHRDIKPENIVMSEGVVKLCDFGWSVYSGDTLRSTFCGTPLYVGPEILKGKEYDQKIDIWSLGVMMYEMLIGENPFKITKEEQLIKIVKDEIKIPSYVDLSEEAKDFLHSCLQKNPENRLSIRQLMNHSFFKKYPEKSEKKMSL